jgi:hypothetical protein
MRNLALLVVVLSVSADAATADPWAGTAINVAPPASTVPGFQLNGVSQIGGGIVTQANPQCVSGQFGVSTPPPCAANQAPFLFGKNSPTLSTTTLPKGVAGLGSTVSIALQGGVYPDASAPGGVSMLTNAQIPLSAFASAAQVSQGVRQANGSTAAALAAAGLAQAVEPGRSMVTGGFGYWQGQGAFAAGFSHRVDDRWTMKANVSISFDGGSGGSAAVGYEF